MKDKIAKGKAKGKAKSNIAEKLKALKDKRCKSKESFEENRCRFLNSSGECTLFHIMEIILKNHCNFGDEKCKLRNKFGQCVIPLIVGLCVSKETIPILDEFEKKIEKKLKQYKRN